MSEFDEKLSSILGNPGAMDQIMALAQSLSGDAGQSEKTEEAPVEKEADPEITSKGIDLVSNLTGEKDPGAELMRALRPYLKEERRERLDRALELARTTRLIRTAIGAMGGKGEGGSV